MSHPLVILAIAVIVLIVLDLATLRWGADSRRVPGQTRVSGSGDADRDW